MVIEANIKDLMEKVLPFRSTKYIDDFTEKLLGEGIVSPLDLLITSKEALEQKLSSHAAFNFIEMADTISLRNAVDPNRQDSLQEAQAKNQQRPSQRSTERRQRSRSRSRNRGRGHGHTQGDRQNSHQSWRSPPRGEKKNKPELWAAIERSDAVAVGRLLQSGADTEEKFEGWSPLMKASEEGSVEIVQMLLEKKVDMEASNKNGRTALSFAAAPSMMNGRTPRKTPVDVLRLLLQNGADAARKDKRGMNPRANATKAKREDALKVFDDMGIVDAKRELEER